MKKNFSTKVIYHQIKKNKEEKYGKVSKDAETFISMLKQDAEKRECFFSQELSNNTFKHCCYISKRMKNLLHYFNDVIVIDTSHKTNRFNLPFIDAVVVTNTGKTATCFIGLLENQKYESFVWALSHLKNQMKKMPIVIFSDEDEALMKGKDYFA